MSKDESFAEALELALSVVKEAQGVTQADFVLTKDNPHRSQP